MDFAKIENSRSIAPSFASFYKSLHKLLTQFPLSKTDLSLLLEHLSAFCWANPDDYYRKKPLFRD